MKVVTARKAQWWGVFVELTCVKVAALCFAALMALGVRAGIWAQLGTESAVMVALPDGITTTGYVSFYR